MKILAIDLGLKRTGLALSDEMGLSTKLLPNLNANSRVKAIEKIMTLVEEEEVKIILIGAPEGQSSYSKAVLSRAQGLKENLDIVAQTNEQDLKIILWDESYSSKKAAAKLVEAGVKKKNRKTKLDAASAAVLIEDYLLSVKS